MSHLTLAERIVIECGIYEKLKLNETAKKIGKSPESISREIRKNRTIAPGEHLFGKGCCFASGCKAKELCGNQGCPKRCVSCLEYDCREICTRYNNSPCNVLSKPPYVCNVCGGRRKYKADRAYGYATWIMKNKQKGGVYYNIFYGRYAFRTRSDYKNVSETV